MLRFERKGSKNNHMVIESDKTLLMKMVERKEASTFLERIDSKFVLREIFFNFAQ